MTNQEKPDALNEQELDQVTGGAGHELSHMAQQASGNLAASKDATPKNAASGQYNPETITRTIHPSGRAGKKG